MRDLVRRWRHRGVPLIWVVGGTVIAGRPSVLTWECEFTIDDEERTLRRTYRAFWPRWCVRLFFWWSRLRLVEVF